jgi:hypothetical protein
MTPAAAVGPLPEPARKCPLSQSLDTPPPATAEPEPRPTSDSRRRSSILAPLLVGVVVVLVAAALVLGIALVFLLGGDDSSDTATTTVANDSGETNVNETPTAQDDLDSAASTTVPAELGTDADSFELSAGLPAPTGTQPLTLRGMGSVTLGMSVAEAEEALHATLELGTPASEGCYYANDPTDVLSPLFMVLTSNGDPLDGKIVRIELGEEHTTRSGIHRGSTRAEVLSAYGDRIVASPHPYGSGPGSEYLTYVPADATDAEYRLVFETVDDRVVAIRAGLLPAVEWIEGCA